MWHILTWGKSPAKWKDRTHYALQQVHETYQYGEEVIREFVDKKESEEFKESRKTITQLFDELERFENSAETNNTLSNLHDKSCKSRPATLYLWSVWWRWCQATKCCCTKNRPERVGVGEKGTRTYYWPSSPWEGQFQLGIDPLKERDIVEVTRFQRDTETILETDVIW